MVGVVDRDLTGRRDHIGIAPLLHRRHDPPLRPQDLGGPAGLAIGQAHDSFRGPLDGLGRSWIDPLNHRFRDPEYRAG